jgi:hypothetical protein
VVFSVMDIPNGGAAPDITLYPPGEAMEEADWQPAPESAGHGVNTLIIKNISFIGHRRWSDPPAAAGKREYGILIPAVHGKRYLFTMRPKRFCFDQGGVLFGQVDHMTFVDVK